MGVHKLLCGLSGEDGPASRCPAAKLSELLDAGITTVVGILGTDDVSRSQDELVVAAKSLVTCGITAFTWIGSYHVPVPTCTGSVTRDMVLLDTVWQS